MVVSGVCLREHCYVLVVVDGDYVVVDCVVDGDYDVLRQLIELRNLLILARQPLEEPQL